MNTKGTACDSSELSNFEEIQRSLVNYYFLIFVQCAIDFLKEYSVNVQIPDSVKFEIISPGDNKISKSDIDKITNALDILCAKKLNDGMHAEDLDKADLMSNALQNISETLNTNNLTYEFCVNLLLYLSLLPHSARLNYESFLSKRNTDAANKKNEPTNRSRDYCIREAALIWSKLDKHDPAYRIGAVCKNLLQKLEKQGLTLVTVSKIRDWLKDAEKEGRLTIPVEASRPGANRTLH